MSNYEIVQLDEKTLHYLDGLHESVYNKQCPKNYFKKKYETGYTGEKYIGYFAMESNRPVAFYGVIPCKVSISNNLLLAAQSCDTMTHPAHQKKGLFVKLAHLTFELAKKRGIHFVFGFPNKNSYHGFVEHLDFVHTETMNRYTFNFSENLIKRAYRKFFVFLPESRGIAIENKLLQQGFDGIIYDEDFFKYKSYNPNFVLTNGSNSFWINKYGHLFIGALSRENPEIIKDQVTFIQKKIKASSITFIISPGTNLDLALSKLCKKEEGYPVIIKDLSGKYLLKNLKFQFADIDIF